MQFVNNIFLSGSLCVCSIYCVNKSLYGSSKLTNPPPITATFDVVSGLLDSILVYFLKKRKKFLCRTSELGYTLQVSQVSRQLQKSGCDVTSYMTTVGVLLILKFSDFLTCISFNRTFSLALQILVVVSLC